MEQPTYKSIVKTSIISAFTIAAALIWKDVIIDLIELLVPPGEEILFKLLAAIFATILIIIAIYIFLGTETEAELLMSKLREKKRIEKEKKK